MNPQRSPIRRHGSVLLAQLVLAASCGGGTPGTGLRELPTTIITYDTAVAPDAGTPAETGPNDPGPTDPGTVDPGTPDPGVDAGPCATEGASCDDGDACTKNDRCVAGQCAGDPIECPDDDVPCTVAVCKAGTCAQDVVPGKCWVGGDCWTDGQHDPAEPCRMCDAAAAPRAWTSADGEACDDGDACTTPDSCLNGACAPGPDTCHPPACFVHSDCAYDRVCGIWYGDMKTYCSVPCAGDAGCAAGEVCTHLSGSANLGYCQPSPAPTGGTYGAKCSSGWDCRSGFCLDSICVTNCSAQAGCTAAQTCQFAGDLASEFSGACVANASMSLVPLGSECTADGGDTYDSSLCRSGHCDLVADVALCAPLCSTDAQCGANQECNFVLRATAANPDATSFKPGLGATWDAALGCYTRFLPGAKGVGDTCTGPSDCRTNKCLQLWKADPNQYCTTWCTTDVDCPSPMTCQSDVANLVGTWLDQFGQGSTTAGFTIVRVCKPPKPE